MTLSFAKFLTFNPLTLINKLRKKLLYVLHRFHVFITVKPVYNELEYNELPLITNHIIRTEHRSHGLLYKMIGYNELAYNGNSKTYSINSIRL